MGLDSFMDDSSAVNNSGGSNRYTDEDLLQALRDFYEEHGYFTSKDYQDKKSSPSYSTIERRFETFNKARQKAGIPTNKSGGSQLVVTDSMREPSADKAYIVGCLLTDGWVTTSEFAHMGFQSSDKELAQEFALRFASWAGIRWCGWNNNKTDLEARGPIDIENSDKSAWRVKKGSKEVSEYINRYQDYTSDELLDEFSSYKHSLLASMWDCEGSISKQKQVKFANSDIEILKLYMKLVADLVGVAYEEEWEWASGEEKYRKYGEFTVSTTFGDTNTRNITIPSAYVSQFGKVVNTVIPRKRERF